MAQIPQYAKESGISEKALSLRDDGGLRVSVTQKDLRARAYFSGKDVDVVVVPHSVAEVDAARRRVDSLLRGAPAPGLFSWGPDYVQGHVDVTGTQAFWSSPLGRRARAIDGVRAEVAPPGASPAPAS